MKVHVTPATPTQSQSKALLHAPLSQQWSMAMFSTQCHFFIICLSANMISYQIQSSVIYNPACPIIDLIGKPKTQIYCDRKYQKKNIFRADLVANYFCNLNESKLSIWDNSKDINVCILAIKVVAPINNRFV